MSSRKRKRIDLQHHDIPKKANRILHIILVALVLIVLRTWHLAVIQYDQRSEEAGRPQRKVVIEPATRATIRDRFNLPLAINKIQYQATILYSQIRDIPSIEWKLDERGKKIKVFKRKEYIRQLSQLLGNELGLESERVEDLIYAKASYYAQVPYVIQEEVSEGQYYKLKMLEKDWPGIHMRRLPKRIYPQGRVAADIIGYMGSINRFEYEKILSEIKALEHYMVAKEDGIEAELPFGIENPVQVQKRLKDLKEKAYSIHDYVGKTGIEGVYEESLRGFYGKKNFYSDSKGNYLHELPGSRAPLSGHRVLLTISSELQEYAEQLLAQNEVVRQVRKTTLGATKNTIIAEKHPWIKGGGIIAMDPHTGEVIALASYPRFDPNDFITGKANEQKEKMAKINRWFESENYIAQIWDQQQPLERERFNHLTHLFYDDKIWMTWNVYLNFILPEDSDLRKAINKMDTLDKAIHLQKLVDEVLALFPDADIYALFNALYPDDELFRDFKKVSDKAKFMELFEVHKEEIKYLKPQLNRYFSDLAQNYDKVLLVDLCRLAVDANLFTSDLLFAVGQYRLDDYHALTGSFVKMHGLLKEMTKELFHDHDFKAWRQAEEKSFLKKKRLEEKAAKLYPKPYIDYLDQQENLLFNQFWEQNHWNLLSLFLTGQSINMEADALNPYHAYFSRWHQELKAGAHKALEWRPAYDLLQKTVKPLSLSLMIDYFKTIRSYHELNRPLLGKYRYLRSAQNAKEKHLASAFYPTYGFGYARSHTYRQATIQGSLFKIITGYTALAQRLNKLGMPNPSLHDLNPLVMVDEVFQKGNTRYVGYTEEGQPIPQLYKGGRLPRSLAHQHSGRVDLLRAMEVSSNPYFSLLAGECLEHPNDLADAAKLFSYGSRTGIELPGEISGKVPTDLATNKTGLYAMAIGQHSLVVTPLQTAVMLAAVANGGKILKPKIVNLTAGREPTRNDQIAYMSDYAFHDSYAAAGLDFPLFTASLTKEQESLVKPVATEIRNNIQMPEIIRKILLRGLRAAALKSYQENLASLTKLYRQCPEAIRHFTELKGQLFGKTSTSEAVENLDLDLNEGTNIYTHVWFGCIAFQKDADKSLFLFKDEFGEPELVVVVYLRYGGFGKEAAPIAAQIVKRWREIKTKMKDS